MTSAISINELFSDVSLLIESAKNHVARKVNASLVYLYWQIGQRINNSIPDEKRSEYGKKTIIHLANQLQNHYGRGFNERALFRMTRFAKYFSERNTVVTLSPLLSWSHFIELIAFDDPLKRQFYTEMCRLELWSVRELRKKIDGLLYERTGIAKQPEELIKKELTNLQAENKLTQSLVFRDPYVLDFLNLPADFSESTLEDAILDELCQFLQELGTDFCFIGRQKRITIDNEDYYLDLLTYHRGLSRLVAIELKLGRFTASHKGQMELYLKWLDKYERRSGENKPLGLVLCANKNEEHIELLELNKSGIHVAQYLTALPTQKILEEKLRSAITTAREKNARLQLLSGNKPVKNQKS